MVENRPGHEDAPRGEDLRDQAPDGAGPESTGDAPAAAEARPDGSPEPHDAAPEDFSAVAAHRHHEDRAEAAAEAGETPDASVAASRHGDETAARPAVAEPHRPGIAAMMLPPILAVAIAAIVVVGAAKTGLLPEFLSSSSLSAPPADAAAIDALKARIAGLESRSAADAKPAAVADATALDALAARIASLEARPAPAAGDASTPTPPASDPALSGKIEALEKTVATLRDDLAALRRQSDQLAGTVKDLKAAAAGSSGAGDASPTSDSAAADKSSADSTAALAAINARLADLEQAAKASTETASKPQPAAAPDDVPLRRLVTATMLDLTVRQGAPYGSILKAAEPLATDAATLKPLEPFAATGVPSTAALGRELTALLPKLLPADEATSNSNFIDRFQANAERLVKIQRSDATPGPDRTAIVGRLAAAAQRGDLAEARRELKALAPADRAPVQSWIDKTEARDQALAASQSFATAALAALSKPSP